VIEITDFKVSVDLIEHLPAQGHVLDFRTADPFYANWPLAGCERFAHDGEERPFLEDFAPFELDHDRQNVGAIESVGPLWFERQFAGRHGLLDHSHVQKERFRALACEYLDAVVHAAVLVVDAKRDGTAARCETAAVLDRPCCAGRTAWNVEHAVQYDLAFAW